MPQVNPYLKPIKQAPSGGDDAGRPGAGGARLEPAEVKPRPPVAGFWRRLGALLFDLLLAYGVFRVLGGVLHDQLVHLGRWGGTLGAVLFFGYRVACHGPLGNGRTLGKMLVGLRVTDLEGNTIGFGRALAREALVFPGAFFAYFLAPVILDRNEYTHHVIGITLSVLSMVALFLGNALCLGFNPFKQGLHDHAMGTLVRPSAAPPMGWAEMREVVGDSWRRYYKQAPLNGLMTFLLIFAALGALFTLPLMRDKVQRGMYESLTAITADSFPGGNTMISMGRMFPPEADVENPEMISREQLEAFHASLADPASQDPVKLEVFFDRYGAWGDNDEQLEETIARVLLRVRDDVIGEMPKPSDPRAADFHRLLLSRPVIFAPVLREQVKLFFFPVAHTKIVAIYEFSYPPINPEAAREQLQQPASVDEADSPTQKPDSD